MPGSLVLVGGDPGIGKSTLLLQSARALAEACSVLYVSAEESAQQVKLRWRRLGPEEGAEGASDQPTCDLLTQRMQVHEKTAWMLRSLLE